MKQKTIVLPCVLLVLSAIFFSGCNRHSDIPRVLVFTKTSGYHHTSIADGVNAIFALAKQNKFEADTTSDSGWFQEDTLKKYAAVVFLNTTGDLLDHYQEADFQRFIEAGGGYVGVHAAADAEYDWGWYGRLAGAYFNGHPEQQEALIQIADSSNDATRLLPKPWKRKDEWYNFKKIGNDLHILLTIDEKSYSGGTNTGFHPVAWYHDFDGGRAWYTALGHTEASYTDHYFLGHLLAGIQYAIGSNQLDYSKAKELRVPEEDRFTKNTLVEGVFFEPTEMTILPNLDVLVVQRRGEFLLYKHDTKTIRQVGFLKVYFKAVTTKFNTEEGLLGVQADPDFALNHYIYAYYSPFDSSVDRLSRFTLLNDTLDPASEKIILQIHEDREICCHTGGSIAFGKDHNLFLSTGDNSTPFDEPGNSPFNLRSFSPLDDRPGFEQYDSRRGAGNTNDLRGKILRIKINPDGTYDIPEGNLFAKSISKTKPEIYVMGDRNPYRISVDQKNEFVYWGEVGPDANNDSMETRGPRGYDEINQARKAGNFGWPYFVGNNYPYHEYNYATGAYGQAFDPLKPVNHSRNNTGLTELPPAQPAFIWYPYGESKDFPQVGTGGRTAMAGPVYYTGLYPDSSRYPEYYDGKLFIYEWIRGWIKAVSMLPNGDFDKMEPFLQHSRFNAPIDMETGPDGRIYILEYGNGWYEKNPDAGLSVIDYNSGNRPPEIGNIHVTKTAGLLPFSGSATVDVKDPENDALSFVWNLGNGTTKQTTSPSVDFSYSVAGNYNLSVEVKDDKGASAKSKMVELNAGNEIPSVEIQTSSNKTFYLPGKPLNYHVFVNLNKKGDTLDPANLYISYKFIDNFKPGRLFPGAGESFVTGKILTQTLDCKSCHNETLKSIGPAFVQVSEKYSNQKGAGKYLMEKVMKGGSGVWGDVAMSAHPDINQTDLRQIVDYILSLSNKTVLRKSLPFTGSILPPADTKKGAALVLSASYSSKGANNVKALSDQKAILRLSGYRLFTGKENNSGFHLINKNNINYFQTGAATGWFAVDSLDLTGISSLSISGEWEKPSAAGYHFEIHLDSTGGKILGKGLLRSAGGNAQDSEVSCKLAAPQDGKFHSLYFSGAFGNTGTPSVLNLKSLEFK
jgi:cytochrome c